jgi:hypothetical protein
VSAELAQERFVLHGRGLSGSARGGPAPVTTLAQRLGTFGLGRFTPAILPVRASLPALDLTVLDPPAQMPLESMPEEREVAMEQLAGEVPDVLGAWTPRDESKADPSMMGRSERPIEAAPRFGSEPAAQRMGETARVEASHRNASSEPHITIPAAVDRGGEVMEELSAAPSVRTVTTAVGATQRPMGAEHAGTSSTPLVDSREVTPFLADTRIDTVGRSYAHQPAPTEAAQRQSLSGTASVRGSEHHRNHSIPETPRVPAHESPRVIYMGQPAAPAAAAEQAASPSRQEMVERLVALGAGQARQETLRIDSVQVVVRDAPGGRQLAAPSLVPVAPARSEPMPLTEFRNPWLSTRHRYD